jgi:8-oxo-dGTP diphosphatase
MGSGEGDGAVEILVVHRPALGYDDWTFPKGKREPFDTDDEHTALREVFEETGMRCSLGRELPTSSYHDRKGRAKVVRYWEMRVLSGSFTANREVDAARWLEVPEARRTLTYDADREILDAFARFAGSPGGNLGNRA